MIIHISLDQDGRDITGDDFKSKCYEVNNFYKNLYEYMAVDFLTVHDFGEHFSRGIK